MMVAVPAAIVPIPLALGVLGIGIIGLSPTNALPVILASLIAHATVLGLGLRGGGVKKVSSGKGGKQADAPEHMG
jgi:hypothetical protein